MFGWALLFCLLAPVVVQTNWVEYLVIEQHITVSAELAQLGISAFFYVGGLAFLTPVVGLAASLAGKQVIFKMAEWAIVRVNQSPVMWPRKTSQPKRKTAKPKILLR